jgi:hypothetical protein
MNIPIDQRDIGFWSYWFYCFNGQNGLNGENGLNVPSYKLQVAVFPLAKNKNIP